MSPLKPVHFYLEDPLRESAAGGRHNFINLVVEVLNTAGFKAAFHPLSASGQHVGEHSLSHMISPSDDQGLVFRRVYHYPFWQIDAVAQRWQWDVAKASFDPEMAAPDARRFYRFWQNRLFGDIAQNTSRDGFIYVPLQGHLSLQRVFQSCTPLEMVEHCLAHAGHRHVVATLHPKEEYSPSDRAALNALARKHKALSIATGEMERYLQTCDYVVTQNSGVAFSGYFFGKAALLFGQIDFHHIAEKADLFDLDQSFATVENLHPDFAKYVWWFWQDQSINAGRDDAKAKIAARFKRFGWI